LKIHYNPKLKQLARNLRKDSTLSEVLLWQNLKNKQMLGYDFHRQKPIDEYIVDFFCPRLKLIIEVDGESHNDKMQQDIERQEQLESLSFHFLRFLDSDVKQNLDGVLLIIKEWIEKGEETHP
jgi:very-short-patch-repair endonuclease